MTAGLSEPHREMLEQKSRVSPEVIAARGYRTVTGKAELSKLGFSRTQQVVPALLIPITDPSGRLATYQLRPDEPRSVKGRTKTRVLKYETPKGSSLALDVNPLSLDKMGDPSAPLWITEGSKKVDALVSQGFCALGLMGVWGWRGTNANGGTVALPGWEHVALNGRTVYLAFDSDVVSKPQVYAALERLKEFLESRGARVRVVYLPDDGKSKTGVDDYLVGGHSVSELLGLASDEMKPPPDDGVERAGPYLIKDGAIHHERLSRDGKVAVPLCNFVARIVSQNERDDGVERTLTLIIEGKLADGRPLPPAEVSAAQFGAMNWPVEHYGTEAVVFAGMGAKDHLRTGIQLFSRNVPRRTTCTHLGWRLVDGQHIYLHAGGFISAPLISGAGQESGAQEFASGMGSPCPAPIAPLNIEVDAPENLRGYMLPDPPEGDALKANVRSSLKFLELAPDRITVPLLAAAYRAPLGNADFAVYVAGTTGAGKSEISALIQQHYGAGLDSRHLPGSWSSTANALEGLTFAAKDALVAVDDYAPSGTSNEVARLNATADRLFRAQGNGAGRGRMRADGTLRPDKPPRGFILSTGEDIPKGHSIRARTIVLELGPKDLNWQRLTEAQDEATRGLYAAAMSGFIAWLAADYKNRTAAFVFNHAKHRDALRIKGHRRTVDAGAQLLAALESFLTFAVDAGVVSETERVAIWGKFENGIKDALEPQAALQSQADPIARFTELLTGIFSSQRAHVEDATKGGCPGEAWGWRTEEYATQHGTDTKAVARGPRLGWVDDQNLYLEPGSLYAALQNFAREQGEVYPLTEQTLLKRLSERGVIQAADKGRTTLKKSFAEAGRLRVVCIPVSTLQHNGAIGAGGANDLQDGKNPCPDDENAETSSGQSGQQKARQEPRPANAPETSGAAHKSGAAESESETKFNPPAPIAPQKSTLEVTARNRQTAYPPGEGTPEAVTVLHRRWRAGDFNDLPALHTELSDLFRSPHASTAQKDRLLELARGIGAN